jgi:hypothetical protein
MFADLKNDFVFRRIFAHHPELATVLLNDLLDRHGDARIAQLAPLGPEPAGPASRASALDLKGRDQAGRPLIVELHLWHIPGSLNRIIHNACRTYASQLPLQQPHAALADVVAVSICDFVLWPDDGTGPVVPPISRWTMREEVSGRRDLRQVQYAFVELPKVSADAPPASLRAAADVPAMPSAQRWAWLLGHASRLEAVPPGLNAAQQAALALAETATFTPAELQTYRRFQDEIEQARELTDEARRKGQEAGLREGEARGKEVGLREGETRGKEAGLREAISDLCEAYGVELNGEQRGQLASLDLTGLTALRSRLKSKRRWPTLG